MSKFGERLKELRLENKLTQEKLGELVKIDQTSISAYELGKVHPTDDVIVVVAKYFKVSADFLLGLED